MNTINLEGAICGYNKKTLVVVTLLILVAGIMFYAGAKYEKKKLLSLGFSKCENGLPSATGKKKSKKQPAPIDNTTPPTDSSTPTDNTNIPNTTNTPPQASPISSTDLPPR